MRDKQNDGLHSVHTHVHETGLKALREGEGRREGGRGAEKKRGREGGRGGKGGREGGREGGKQ